MSARTRVVVVGGGVSGLTTAVCLLEAGADVLVRTAGAPLGTVSAIAGAMCGPVGDQPDDLTRGWAARSEERLRTLAGDPSTGVTVRRGRFLPSPLSGDGLPPWAPTVPGYRPLTPDELPPGFEAGFRGECPFADMPIYLAWLVDRLRTLGGRLEQSPVRAFGEITGADVVVNATGLAAADLTGDDTLTPLRGQHVVVDAPLLTDFLVETGHGDAWMSVFPHGRRVLLGGVLQAGYRDLAPDPRITEQILARAIDAVPALADAPVIGVEVGLRPGRPAVRLERELVDGVPVVHNYGHGMSGVLLSWGCAERAVQLALR